MVKIEWTDEAENDLDDIMAYISKTSFQYARSFFKNVHKAITNLTFFPKWEEQFQNQKIPKIEK